MNFYLIEALFILPCYIYLCIGLIQIELNCYEPFFVPKENKIIETHQHFCTGEGVHRCSINFSRYECSYYFYDKEPIIPIDFPIVDVNLTNVTHLKTVFCAIAPLYCEKMNLYYVKQSYVKQVVDVVLNDGKYFMLYSEDPKYEIMKPTKQSIYATKCYNYALFVPNIFWYGFGHWFTDVLSGLMLLPEWVWDLKPVFVIACDINLVKFTLTCIGHGDIETVNSRNYIYAENLFVFTGNEEWHTFGMHSCYLLKQKFHDSLKLNEIEPVHYYYRNKSPGWRHFINLNEIMNLAREQTGLDWKLFSMPYNDRVNFAKEFATIKILVIPCGSIAFNTIYLHDGTGLVTLFADSIDYPQIVFCYFLRIWNIGVVHEQMGHNGKAGYGSVERILESIKRMIYTVEHQHYPANHSLFVALNINDAKQVFSLYNENHLFDYNISVDERYQIYRQQQLKQMTS